MPISGENVNPVTWSDPTGRMAVEIATLETKITLEDLVILGLLGYATTCVYYFTYISVLQLAGFDVTFARALAPDGCEPPDDGDDDDDCPPWTDWTPPYPINGDATGQVHHIATNKHTSVWTPIFADIFSKGGLSLDCEWNTIRLEGHLGRHKNDYHIYVSDRLFGATAGKKCNPYRHALQRELWKMKEELMTPGSKIRKLLNIADD